MTSPRSLPGIRIRSSWSVMRYTRSRPMLAVEDAIILAKWLRDIPDHALAFATYERLRRARAERMVQHGRNAGQGKAMTNPIGVWFRDLLAPLFLKLFANPATGD